MQCTFCRPQLDELVSQELSRMKDVYGNLRIPRNSNNIETLDDLQAQYSFFLKSQSPVPSRRPSLIRLWCSRYGIVDTHFSISDLLDATVA